MRAKWVVIAAALFFSLASYLRSQSDVYVNGATGLDSPGQGSTSAAPFKTIGFALANSAPPFGATTTVHIAGNQVYSVATNGESFPIQLPPGFALLGDDAPADRPVLATSASATLQLNPNADYNPHAFTLKQLAFAGGAIGLEAGASSGFLHRVHIENCTFTGQAIAGIWMRTFGGQESATVQQTQFGDIDGSGVLLSPSTNLIQSLRVDLSNFESCVEGIRVEYAPFAGYPLYEILVDQTLFDQCGTALHDYSTAYGWTPLSARMVRVQRSHVSRCSNGILRHCFGHMSSETQVMDTTFVDCGVGATFSFVASSPHVQTISVARCGFLGNGAGIHIHGLQGFTIYASISRIQATGNGTAVMVSGNSDLSGIWLDVSNSRIVDGHRGLDLSMRSDSGHANLATTMIANMSDTGVAFASFPGDPYWPSYTQFTARRLTIADCAIGIHVQEYAKTNQLGRILFDGNGVDLYQTGTGQPWFFNVDWCSTNAPSLFGNNHLAGIDSQLLRPHYKLRPGSPCIDVGPAGVPQSHNEDYEGDPLVAPGLPGAAPSADIGADEYVASGSIRPFGTRGLGAEGVQPQALSLQGQAALGSAYSIDLEQAAPAGGWAQPGSFAILGTGFQDARSPFPYNLVDWGISGSVLWITPHYFHGPFAVTTNGTASFSLAVPNITGLAGLVLQHQWLLGGPYGLVASDALRVTLGQ